MPDRRRHRGPHPRDAALFGPEALPALRAAVEELSWLLTRGYAVDSALVLVGNRHQLADRQRTAVLRCSCSDRSLERRRASRLDDVAGSTLHLDGYNVLTTLEAALAGGYLIRGRDGCLRDMASMHGTWRAVEETVPALDLARRATRALGARRCVWYLDKPVSNSGRLKARLEEADPEWEVHLVPDPDPLLARSEEPVATADSVILDRCRGWVDLTGRAVPLLVPQARILDLG